MQKKDNHIIAAQLVKRCAKILSNQFNLHENDGIVVGVSSGPDSLALLFLLHQVALQLDIAAIYIDHGLRANESPHEIELIKGYCQELNCPFFVRQADVKGRCQSTGESPEAAGRMLRYQALEEVRAARQAKYIAVGHTADDQVEQFFIRLIRGSGRDGLSGMTHRHGVIIRPLLKETKRTLIAFLNAIGKKYCIDSSNEERCFLRNRVRLDLLPLLEKDFTPAIRAKILQVMEITRGEDDFLAQQTEAAMHDCVIFTACGKNGHGTPQVRLLCQKFMPLHQALQRRVVQACLISFGNTGDFRQIDIITKFIQSGRTGKELHLDDGLRVSKQQDTILFNRPHLDSTRASLPASSPVFQEIDGPGEFLIMGTGLTISIQPVAPTQPITFQPGVLFADASKISFPLILRSGKPGDRFTPCNSTGTKKISRYFNAKKIAARDRPRWPILSDGERIIAIPGLVIDDRVKLTEATKEIYKIERICN